jgi:fimbrial isopeptide formation D2 family protein/MYXO-CTERM domain-containing protein
VGTPQSMSGVDIDIVDVGAKLKAGDQAATIVATSSEELYFLAGWVTSISTYGQDFSGSKKVAADLDGTPTLRGDPVEYRITAANSGNDDSIDTVVVDKLPKGVSFVPGSLGIVEGDNARALTDAAGDDAGEYDPKSRTVTVRVGSGADQAQGGSVGAGKSAIVRFEVTVDEDAVGIISNQASVSAAGKLGAPLREDVTDGNGAGEGAPPTDIAVQPDQFYGGGSGVFGPCSAGPGAGSGSAAWLVGVALATLLRRRRKETRN